MPDRGVRSILKRLYITVCFDFIKYEGTGKGEKLCDMRTKQTISSLNALFEEMLPEVPQLNDETTHQGWTDMAVKKCKWYREEVRKRLKEVMK